MSKYQMSPDEWLRQNMEIAHHFSCTILQDRRYRTARFETLAEARAYRPKLEALAGNGRKAMVYVIDRLGRSTFVPEDFA